MGELSNKSAEERDLYSLLKVDRNATEEEIHRAYKSLSTTFHPDKLPPNTSAIDREQIQPVFLEFKRAHDTLIDPVLRLAYDHYGDEGVSLIKQVQQQRREQQTRRDAHLETSAEEDDEDDEVEASLYDKVERLLGTNPLQARQELQKFMEQHDYHEDLTEYNQVQLGCSMDFPPVVDLKGVFFDGRDYLQQIKQRAVGQARGMPAEDRRHFQQRIKEEHRLVDYQINRIRDSQKGSVGFTLSSNPPRNVRSASGEKSQPKWSMAMGASTDLIYPGVAEVVTLAGKEKEEQKHPASTFVNMVYQPVPDSQINLTANLSNDQSHQFVLGSARNFSNRSSHRYSLTFLTKSPLDTNMILNFKSFRHIKDIGMTSGGISFGADGKFLNWNAKWEGTRGTENIHKCSAKVAVGMMQGSSLEVSYKLKSRKTSWLDEYMVLPKTAEVTVVAGNFPKVEAMVTQEFNCLASHPTLAFGMEHDISIGCWIWIWEWTYNNSCFRIPIPVLHLGSISDPTAYYGQKFYYGIYCMLIQSVVADVLKESDATKEPSDQNPTSVAKLLADLSDRKTKRVAEQQLKLMESTAERKRYSEKCNEGLIILKGTYFLEHQCGDDIQLVTMDTTVQLQFWVSKGRLSLPPGPKASLLGFFDLHTELNSVTRYEKWDWRIWKRWTRREVDPELQDSKPQLRVRYSHKGYVYELTVSELDQLILPSSSARLLGHASLVH